MIYNNVTNSSPRKEIDHLLGYYNLQGIYNEVFYYSQQTVRHNVFEGGTTGSEYKFIPVFLHVYQVPHVHSSWFVIENY